MNSLDWVFDKLTPHEKVNLLNRLLQWKDTKRILDEEEIDLLRNNKKILAVKAVKERYDITLAMALSICRDSPEWQSVGTGKTAGKNHKCSCLMCD
jgi:hypothetical protein